MRNQIEVDHEGLGKPKTFRRGFLVMSIDLQMADSI
jgi:hypothetical protein